MWATPSSLTKAPCCTMSDLYFPNSSTVSIVDVVKLRVEVGKAKKRPFVESVWTCAHRTTYTGRYLGSRRAAWYTRVGAHQHGTLQAFTDKKSGVCRASVHFKDAEGSMFVSWYTGFLTNRKETVITLGKHHLKHGKFIRPFYVGARAVHLLSMGIRLVKKWWE